MAIEKMGTSKGGPGGRVINIASLAGIFTGLGGIQEVGYVMSKHGVVALTRSFEDAHPKVINSDGIKAYAICPYFANTQLVKESVAIDDLSKKIKGRVLTVNEVSYNQFLIFKIVPFELDVIQVGHALDHSLKLDINGACYAVYPDCPVFRVPNMTPKFAIAMIGFGQQVAAPLGIEDFTLKHLFALALVVLAFVYLLLTIIF